MARAMAITDTFSSRGALAPASAAADADARGTTDARSATRARTPTARSLAVARSLASPATAIDARGDRRSGDGRGAALARRQARRAARARWATPGWRACRVSGRACTFGHRTKVPSTLSTFRAADLSRFLLLTLRLFRSRTPVHRPWTRPAITRSVFGAAGSALSDPSKAPSSEIRSRRPRARWGASPSESGSGPSRDRRVDLTGRRRSLGGGPKRRRRPWRPLDPRMADQ